MLAVVLFLGAFLHVVSPASVVTCETYSFMKLGECVIDAQAYWKCDNGVQKCLGYAASTDNWEYNIGGGYCTGTNFKGNLTCGGGTVVKVSSGVGISVPYQGSTTDGCSYASIVTMENPATSGAFVMIATSCCPV